MGFDAFIKIDGIVGESSDDKHSGWIGLISNNIDINQVVSTTANSSGGASVERADFSDFTFKKLFDKWSPKPSMAGADGTHIDSIVIELCRAGTDKIKFMEYKLTNSIIGEVSISGSGEFPTETVSIDYGKIAWIYTMQRRQGGGSAGSIATGWDLQKRCRI